MKRLLDKVAIITGGNSGIGKGIAQHFYNEGAKVVIFGRNQETLAATKAEIGNIFTVAGDVTNSHDLKNLFIQTQQQFGKIDIVVSNAGIAKRIHVEKITEQDFDDMINVNYRAAFFTAQYAVPHLNPKAAIIFIASVGAHITLKNHSVYTSAKAAVIKLAKTFANDLAYKGIRVNSISPGYIKTPIFDERLQTDVNYLARREVNIPLKRIGTPQDIAQAALFLASEEASYITGVDLIVDGGYTASFPELEK